MKRLVSEFGSLEDTELATDGCVGQFRGMTHSSGTSSFSADSSGHNKLTCLSCMPLADGSRIPSLGFRLGPQVEGFPGMLPLVKEKHEVSQLHARTLRLSFPTAVTTM